MKNTSAFIQKETGYTASILVSENEMAVFHGINSIKNWWTIVMEGKSEELNDVFTVRFGETFIKIRITEMIPGKRIGWKVIDGFKHWINNHQEWIGTSMLWEIRESREGTHIHFTHIGLIPGMECYGGCEIAWDEYIKGSLYQLLEEGIGKPELK